MFARTGSVSVEIISQNRKREGKRNPRKSEVAGREKKVAHTPINIRHVGKEGNRKKIQGGSIIIPYPTESIYHKEEGSILVQVYKESHKEAAITVLEPSPYENLNKASVEALKKALFSIKEEDYIDQKFHITFTLKK